METNARAAAHDADILAKELAWQDRSKHDVSCDRDDLWEHLAGETRERYLNAAKVANAFHERRIDLGKMGNA